MGAFVAKFPGRCAGACGEPVKPGEEVVYVDDELVHLDCEGRALRPRRAEVCAVCWLEKPCPCDDGRSAA